MKGEEYYMSPEELKFKFSKASSDIDNNKKEFLLQRSIKLGDLYDFPKGSINLLIAMEELSELQKELSKYVRNKGNKLAVTEEIADVYICIDKVKSMLDISDEDINKIINIKLDRLDERDSKLIAEMKSDQDLSLKIQEETLREIKEE